jgi:hypothetical protein
VTGRGCSTEGFGERRCSRRPSSASGRAEYFRLRSDVWHVTHRPTTAWSQTAAPRYGRRWARRRMHSSGRRQAHRRRAQTPAAQAAPVERRSSTADHPRWHARRAPEGSVGNRPGERLARPGERGSHAYHRHGVGRCGPGAPQAEALDGPLDGDGAGRRQHDRLRRVPASGVTGRYGRSHLDVRLDLHRRRSDPAGAGVRQPRPRASAHGGGRTPTPSGRSATSSASRRPGATGSRRGPATRPSRSRSSATSRCSGPKRARTTCSAPSWASR